MICMTRLVGFAGVGSGDSVGGTAAEGGADPVGADDPAAVDMARRIPKPTMERGSDMKR